MDTTFWYLVGSGLYYYAQQADIKLWYLVAAYGFGIASFIFYFNDLVHGDTCPHPVSWFVWLITQVIATVTSIIGGGGYGAYYGVFYCCTIGTILIYSILSKKSKVIQRSDRWGLAIALHSILIWVLVGNPLVSSFMATGIDGYAFFPSIRDAYYAPWSESVKGWALMIPNGILTLMALEAYNWYTLPYQIAMLILTTSLVLVCVIRRLHVPRPM